jgi:hypothetical protein
MWAPGEAETAVIPIRASGRLRSRGPAADHPDGRVRAGPRVMSTAALVTLRATASSGAGPLRDGGLASWGPWIGFVLETVRHARVPPHARGAPASRAGPIIGAWLGRWHAAVQFGNTW